MIHSDRLFVGGAIRTTNRRSRSLSSLQKLKAVGLLVSVFGAMWIAFRDVDRMGLQAFMTIGGMMLAGLALIGFRNTIRK
jgi:hypothetical protein